MGEMKETRGMRHGNVWEGGGVGGEREMRGMGGMREMRGVRESMAQKPILPIVGGLPSKRDEDLKMAEQDADGVWRELHNLAHEEYLAWRAALYEEADLSVFALEAEDDDGYGWSKAQRDAEVEGRLRALLEARSKDKNAELRKRHREAFEFWWSEEYVKVAEGRRVRRRGEVCAGCGA